MSFTTQIDKFKNDVVIVDGSNVTKKLVGFRITRSTGEMFIIDKWLTIDSSKDDDAYASEAYAASLDEINEWKDTFNHVSKTFNPDTGKMEEPSSEEE